MFAINGTANAQKDFIPSNMCGTYHNEMIEIYLEKYKDNPSGDFLEIYNRIGLEFEKKHPGILSKEDFAGGMFGPEGSIGYSLLVSYIQDTYHGGGCM